MEEHVERRSIKEGGSMQKGGNQLSGTKGKAEVLEHHRQL
jgi:hypothetical protein